MHGKLSIVLTIFFSCAFSAGGSDRIAACLPKEIDLEEKVSATVSKVAQTSGPRITVGESLLRIKARCRKGKLVDGAGKEIYFYRLKGCWGNPPVDYQGQITQQELELRRLRKKYRVIEISCSQSGDIRLIH